MKTRYYILILLMLWCLPQVLHAQLKPAGSSLPIDELLPINTSVTKSLSYHDTGENTANYYRFTIREDMGFRFSFSDFHYSQGWGEPLSQNLIFLYCALTMDGVSYSLAEFAPTADGKTGELLPYIQDEPLLLRPGHYQFTITHRGEGAIAGPLSSQSAVSYTSLLTPPTYGFRLHIATEAPPVDPTLNYKDEDLPAIPSANPDSLISLPATSDMNSVCTFSSCDGSGAEGDFTVNYVDGLGRSVETARRGHAAHAPNVVALQEYDSWGRKGNTWLEAATNNHAGTYVSPAIYSALASQTNDGDSRPYTEIVYEESPLNRPVRQYGPGADWKSKGKAVNIVYTSNTAAAGELRCLKFTAGGRSSSGMPVTSDGYYAAGSLQVVKIADEDGRIKLEFTDRNGNIVLSRHTELKGSTTALYDTYYVYDGAGNLRAVLPPELSAQAVESGSLSQAELNKYAYLYSYDSFRRLSCRKLPATGWEVFVYDAYDRLLFSQDENLSKEGKWRFSIPDNFGRPCLEGVCTGYSFRSRPPLPENYSFCRYLGKDGQHHGYELRGVTLDSPVFHRVNYYDNYRFLADSVLLTAVAPGSFAYLPRAGYGQQYVSAKGSLTGTLTAQLGASGEFLGHTFFYDARARLIQSHSSNHLKGVDSEYLSYNFSGQPLKRLLIHSVPGKASLTETYTHTYSPLGLPLLTKHRLDNGTEVILSDKEYDALGRLSKEKRNGNSNLLTGYAYNIRSWLKEISGVRFSQNLYYNSGGSNATPCYTGNISSMTWQTDAAPVRGYKYTYDKLNRLTHAVYGEGATLSSNANRFTEQVTGYDKNGNILGLKRYGRQTATAYGLIDNLSMTLNGNRLKEVQDFVTTPAYNGGFEFKDYTAPKDTGGSGSIFDPPARLPEDEFGYDSNGNLTKDLNKNISSIQYNVLNLPSKVFFKDGNSISYLYGADGVKYRTIHQIGGITTTTDYCGNVIYENGTQKQLLTEAGYISLSDKKYYYYLQDHQGNNRVVINHSGDVEETNHYYPFGGVFSNTSSVQPYKYNGKELDTKNGLNWYDYGARMYDAALGRFTTVDPKAEKYFRMTPYLYCGGNPVNYIDPWGLDYWFTNDPDEIARFLVAARDSYFYKNNFIDTFTFSSWNHSTDADFLGGLTFNDEKNMFYSSYGTIEDGIATRVGVSLPALSRDDEVASVEGSGSRWYKRASGRMENVYPEFDILFASTKAGFHIVKNTITSLFRGFSTTNTIDANRSGIVHSGANKEKMGRGRGNMSGNHDVQNEQAHSLSNKYGLDKKQQEILHELIHGQGYGYKEIEQVIKDYFNK